MTKKNLKTVAREAAKKQIHELRKINSIFNNSFLKAIDLIYNCKGKVICSGIGKSAIAAERTSKLFSSIGMKPKLGSIPLRCSCQSLSVTGSRLTKDFPLIFVPSALFFST